MKLPESKQITPLWVIAAFVLLTEAILGIASIQLTGDTQLLVIIFFLLFPLAVFIAFVVILWKKPWVLYSPSEYSDSTPVREFVPALRNDPKEDAQVEGRAVSTADEILELTDKKEMDALPIANQDGPEIEGRGWSSYFDEKNYAEAYRLLSKEMETSSIEEMPGVRGRAAYVKSFIDYQEGIKEAELAINAFPKDAFPYYYLSQIYLEKQLPEDAVSILNKGTENTEEAIRNFLIYEKSRILNSQNKFELQQELLENLAISSHVPYLKSMVFKDLARLQKTKGDVETAKLSIIQAYKENPRDTSNLEDVASFFSELKEHKIELFFRRLIVDLDPTSSTAWGLLGNCYVFLNFDSVAMEAYVKANVLADNKESWVISNIGNLLYNTKQYFLAIEQLKKAIELDPDSEYSHERLSDALKEQKAAEKQIKEILETITFDRALPEKQALNPTP